MSRTKRNKPDGGRKAVEAQKRKRDAANDPDAQEPPAKKSLISDSEVPKSKLPGIRSPESTEGDLKQKDASKPQSQSNSRRVQTEYNEAMASESPDELAARFTAAIKKYKGDLSTIELEDQSIPAKAFRDTTNFSKPRIVSNLSSFLEEQTEGAKEELSTCESEASPHTLLITFSAIRSVDLVRGIREFGTAESKIAKLFAKHMKISEMVPYVKGTRFGIGSGTPFRIEELIKQDALKVDKLKRIVIDGSYVDDKKTTIFSSRDGFLQTLSLLNLDQVKLRFFSGETEVLVF